MKPGDLVVFNDKLRRIGIKIRIKKFVNKEFKYCSIDSSALFLYVQTFDVEQSVNVSFAGDIQSDHEYCSYPRHEPWCLVYSNGELYSMMTVSLIRLEQLEQAETLHVDACIEELLRVEDTLACHPKTLHVSGSGL